ncbi:hypothetical protein SEA_YOGI_59 [Rhodococcus phage Yogi]|nr:hypothetical protein SEA_YOGI_59 [Rhodococcus phage Yogi]
MSKKHRRDSDEPKLTLAEVEALKNKGLTQSEIAK